MTPDYKEVSKVLAKRALGLVGAFAPNVGFHHDDFLAGSIDLEYDDQESQSCPVWLSSIQDLYGIKLDALLVYLEGGEYILLLTSLEAEGAIVIDYNNICPEWYENSTKTWAKCSLEFIYGVSSLIESITDKGLLWDNFAGDELQLKKHLQEFLAFTS
jgi:hypothetical protein